MRIGLSDGTYSEVVAGDLKEGTEVIVGARVDGKGPARAAGKGPRFGF